MNRFGDTSKEEKPANRFGDSGGKKGTPVTDIVHGGINTGYAALADTFIGNPIAGLVNTFSDAGIKANPVRRFFDRHGITVEPNNPIIGRAGKEIGMNVLPVGGLMGMARTGAGMGIPIIREVAEAAGRNPASFAVGDMVAAGTGGFGAGIANELAPGNPMAEMIGQAAGGVAPGLLGAAVRASMRAPNIASRAQDFATAGVVPTAGQVGNVGTQTVEGVMRGAPGSTHVMAGVGEAQAEQMGDTVSGIARNLAGDISPEAAGRTIEKGIRGFVSRKQGTASKLWGKLDDLIAPDTPTSMANTQAVLSELTGKGKLSQLFTSPTLTRAAKLTDGAGSLSYQELRDLRSTIGAKLGDADLISDIPRSDLKRVYAALTKDIKAAASQAGSDGLEIFERANKYTRGLHQRVDNVLEPLLRRTTPEKLYNAVRSGDASTLRSLKRSLTGKQWQAVTGTVIDSLGRARPNQQDASGGVFNPDTFLTEWNKLGPEVRKVFFAGDYEKNLDAIARAAAHMKQNRQVLFNTSGTAALQTNIAAGFTGAGALATGNVQIPLIIALGAGSANTAARLFTSPKFVRWLAKADASGEALPTLGARLMTELASEPEEVQAAASEYLSNL